MTNPTSKLHEDWKLEFANGTTIKGAGSRPEVWRLVWASEKNTKKNSKGTMEGVLLPNVSQEVAKDDVNSRNRIAPNKEVKEDIGKAERLRDLKVSPITTVNASSISLFYLVCLKLISGQSHSN